MKKLLITSAFFAASFVFGQNIEFSSQTKDLYKQLIETGESKGLSYDDAVRAALENREYKALAESDLAASNEKANKAGIMYSKSFGYIALHKEVAILPFVTDFDDQVTKKQSKKKNIKTEKELSEKAQEALFSYLMKNQFDYSVKFQDINRTNQMLKASGVLNVLSSTTDDELAKILGVDGVIRGEFLQELSKSSLKDQVQISPVKTAASTLTGIPLSSNKKSTGVVKLTIGDGTSGDVLWRIEAEDKKLSSKGGDKIIANIMDRISKYFPYSTEFSK